MPLFHLLRNSAYFLLFFLLTANNFLFGQTPAIEWQKCYGGSNEDFANSIQQTSDGGYIVAGFAVSGNDGDITTHHGNASVGDLWILKIDIHGNIEWQKSLGGSDSEQGAYIMQTADGGYIVAGSAASRDCNLTGNHGGFDFWVVKLNDKGDILWQKMYGGSNEDFVTSFAATQDGGYFVAGHTLSNDGDVKGNNGGMDWWVIKIDGTGNLIWQKCLGGSKYEQANSIQSTADGGCIVAGWEESTNGNVTGNHGIGDYWLVKLDKSGNLQWQKTYGGTALDEAWSVRVTNDGGYIVVGHSGSYDGDVTGKRPSGPGDYDTWIMKTDNAGNIQWKNCYGGTANESGYSIQLTADGGYVVAGFSSSDNFDLTCHSAGSDAWVFKINQAGDLQWQKSFGSIGNDEVSSIQPLNDGSFIVAGYTTSSDLPGYHPSIPAGGEVSDYWVVKLSAPQNLIPAPTVILDPSSGTICTNNLATIKAEASFAGLNPTYQWTRNGIPVGTNSPEYTASDFQDNDVVTCTVISDGTSCGSSGLQTTQSLTIHSNTNFINPTISITADNNFVCGCTTNNFIASVTKSGASPVFEWQVNGQNTGVTSQIFSSNTLKPGDIITCAYSDNTGCVAGGSVVSNSIQMNNSAGTSMINITASSDTVCAGTLVTFNATTSSTGNNLVYQWRVNNSDVGNNSPIFGSTTLTNNDQVSCILTVANACTSVSNTSDTITMAISPSPVINITPQDTIINLGAQIKLNSSITGSFNSFQWTPADKLNDPTALSPTTIPLTDNTTYTLTAVNNDGCTSSQSVVVKVFKYLYMPNAFTPNGDGKNDFFRIPPEVSIDLEDFSIYDRWGTKIFTTKTVGQGWDGTIHGIKQVTGVYVYIIKGTSVKGKIFFKGSFVLIR